MTTINKTIILGEGEKPYTGECTANVFNKAENVISLENGIIKIYKVKNLPEFQENNKLLFNK